MDICVLQFDTLPELAAYSKQVSSKGYKINVQRLTIECRLNDEELAIACWQFAAKLLTGNKA